jgi:hypothetical protein
MGFPVLISVDACSLCRDFVHFLQSLFLDSLTEFDAQFDSTEAKFFKS